MHSFKPQVLRSSAHGHGKLWSLGRNQVNRESESPGSPPPHGGIVPTTRRHDQIEGVEEG